MVALRRDDEQAPPPPQLSIVARNDVLRRVRVTALPDGADYRDSGCELAASCLRCPFARCQYEEPRVGRRMGNAQRDREIALLRREHRAPIMRLAATYGVSRRTIFRVLRDQRRRRTEK